ncbi:MAG: hypothetical protein GY816_01350 [Cytophagales bacterium]|nr:hypothetical protein [Cytophagales bacterium]
MRRILIPTLAIILTVSVFGQGNNPGEKIRRAKIALITERLDLSPDQAEKFWPIYNEYSKKQRDIRQSFEQAKKNYQPKNASEQDNQQLLELGMKTKEQALQLEKNYSDRLLKVINNRQMLSLRKAETDFKIIIMKRIQDQRQKQQQMQDNRQRNVEDIKRRRNN